MRYFFVLPLLVSLPFLGQAQAELVFEDQQQQQNAEERGNLRQAIGASVKAETAQVASASAAQAAPEVEHLSRTEMMRRERVREEIKNEDLLQERLEELRLRDEKGRTKQIFGSAEAAQPEKASPSVSSLPVQSEVVGGAIASADAVTMAPQAPSSPVADRLQSSQASVSIIEPPSVPAAPRFSIQPRGGISSMYNAGYEVRPHFSGGIGVSAQASEYISVEAGYTYSEYGVTAGSNNLFVQQLQATGGWNGNWHQETFGKRQNLFDLGAKLHFLSRDSAIRPFLGGGAEYEMSFVNYSQSFINTMNSQGLQFLTADSQNNNFNGFLSAGVDIKVSDRIAVGAMFRYHTLLSSLGVSQPPTGIGAYGYNPYASQANFEKQAVATALSQNSFYSVLAGLTFSF